ncbi:hypothetical protein Clacol_003875 [Clathrus columnatus]|uniref:Uncharacterized protein n=1 Tax=Clathrus columnatus TaxID=1419009 RepID=A0AAV5AAX2_9AGAM|nr:hypothetical protein Clacol_003875 [Clathrus columnatus]
MNGMLKENSNVSSALQHAEARLAEFYAEQARMEEEMATRMEIAEKLRSQVRELEKDKREALRRYAEQTASFEAERQALYDNEQHLKSRIQSLTASRKLQQEAMEQVKEELAERSSTPPEPQEDDRGMIFPSPRPPRPAPKEDDMDVSDGPEITALKLELSTLTTSHTSLQTTVQMLQAELGDLKRVNNTLQEENESYSLLLMERALNGTGVDMLRRVSGQEKAVSSSESFGVVEDRNPSEEPERSSLRSSKKSMLDRVAEDDELTFHAQNDDIPDSLAAELQKEEVTPTSLPNHRRRRTRLNSTSTSPTGTPVGESLADLPITGPGLDLAAELGRAENKDILDGRGTMNSSNSGPKFSDSPVVVSGEVEALRQEVKSLKDANKALSLYASKIIDRIIMQEGFEHVLSVDYDSKTSGPKSPGAFDEVVAKASKETPPRSPAPKAQGFFLTRAASASAKASTSSTNKENLVKFPSTEKNEKLTTFDTHRPTATNADKRNRRSMSFDWRSFSMFGGTSNSMPDKEKNLRPLTLRPGALPLTNARKLESEEDDDDRKERERLNATMKLMGVNKPPEEVKPVVASTPEVVSNKPPSSNRFSFFGLMSKPAPTPVVEPPTPSAELTSEALEQAEAEANLASLDAREKILSAEIAKGTGSGFTELQTEGRLSLGEQWRSQRSRSASGKSHSSGASTVWSAGLRAEED